MPEGCIRLARLLAIAAPIPASFAAWLSDRLRAIWELYMPETRELAGLHEFDGRLRTSRRLE